MKELTLDYSYYELKDVEYPTKPRKPTLPSVMAGPEAFRKYATKLGEWESLLEEYKEKRNSIQKLEAERMQEFKEELFSLYAYDGTSRETFEIIYQKAWEDGHSHGLWFVAEGVNELCGFVDDIIKSIDKYHLTS